MPGFFGFISTDYKPYSMVDKKNLVNEEIKKDNIYLHRHTLNKFLNDKIFKETNNYIFILDGFIFNLQELKIKYNRIELGALLEIMYENLGEAFFNNFRGSFCGLIYDKVKEILIVYTDHIGDKQLFYYKDDKQLVFSSKIVDILSYCKEMGIHVSLNKEAAYLMLTNSYYFEDITPITEVKKLEAGTYLKYSKEGISTNRYHLFNNSPNNDLNEDEIIENIDLLFKQSVSKCLNKNREYGYNNMVSLSGGLDSRMTTWVLNDVKRADEKIINYTYSQSNYLDEIIAKSVANYLGNQLMFTTLDNGLSLTRIDEATQISEGMILYTSLGQLIEFTELINFENIGLIHTGMLGDVIVGAGYASGNRKKELNILGKAASLRLINKVPDIKLKHGYKNQEIFNFYSRGFSGMNLGTPSIMQEYSESFSPFYDLDFMEYCLTIPLKYRNNHNIYFKWILKKHPQAAKFKWENYNTKITAIKIKISGKKIPISQLLPKILKKTGIFNIGLHTQKQMHPYDYWYSRNTKVKNYINNYFSENINYIQDEELKNDCNLLFFKGTMSEKSLVLSFLASVKMFRSCVNIKM
ncbi:MAG: asparagine synthase-related protein [Ignavibacteriaceae bacterium]|nr:asparagine synthase-related protein [Ignavibacteriaceae bacterium]